MDDCPEAKQSHAVAMGCNPDHVAPILSSDCKIQYHSRFLFSAFTCKLVTDMGSETIY